MIPIILTVIGGLGVAFSAWRLARKYYIKIKSYYQIVVVLCEAIEDIEYLTDVIPDQAVIVARTVKSFVHRSLNREDRKRLDAVLSNFGYLSKKGGK